MVIRIRFAMLTAGNYGMIAPGNHGDFGFAAGRTTPGEGFLGVVAIKNTKTGGWGFFPVPGGVSCGVSG